MTDFTPAAGWIVAAMLAGLWWVDRRWHDAELAQRDQAKAESDGWRHHAEYLAEHVMREYNALRRMIRR